MPPADLLPSNGMRRAAEVERQRIDRARRRLEERQQRLREQLDEIQSELAALEERGALLARIIAPAPDLITKQGTEPRGSGGALKGRALRERAVQILLAHHGANRDVHYREWLDDVLAEGYDLAAKDPPAAFLTTVSRSPLVVRGAEPGTYRIDLEQARSLRRRQDEAEAELADLAVVMSRDPNPSRSLREHRTRLTADLRRLERETDEIDRVLEATDAAVDTPEVRVYRVA